MQLYEQKFEDALSYLSRPDILHPTGDKPICYVKNALTTTFYHPIHVYRLQ